MSHPQEEGSSQLVQHPVREPPDELSYLFHSTVWLMLCVNRPVVSRLVCLVVLVPPVLEAYFGAVDS